MTRVDKRGLHDLLFNTKVISVEKENKTESKNTKKIIDAEYKEEVPNNGEKSNKQKGRKK